ncbi:MAG: hypothetical protein HC802_13565 [Caldilineaceae bacterium]|nr:hypothetical protein [Caldilineaceae bacterium]
MNANAFRHFYEYHFTENHNLWDSYITQLSPVQFTQDASYSHGSVRDQIVHLMSVDEAWFSGLRDVEFPEPFPPADFDDRENIRAYWDNVEQAMRHYLAQLQDDMLFTKPIEDPQEDQDLLPLASASPSRQSRHRPPCPTAPTAQRPGRENHLTRLHLLRLRQLINVLFSSYQPPLGFNRKEREGRKD